MTTVRVALAATPDAPEGEVARLEQLLALPVVPLLSSGADVLLVRTQARLELREVGATTRPIYTDFVAGRAGYRLRANEGKKQPLARAVGLKNAPLNVVDATAGFGRDAFVLATLGCKVTLVERSSIVAALLADGLARAATHPETAAIVARMQLVTKDATLWLRDLPHAARPEVVYLDPMYPHRDKRALQKKALRLLRVLVGADEDAAQLLGVARACATRRVVVKRPRGAVMLETPPPAPPPDGVVESKNTRYDIYLRRETDSVCKPVDEPVY